MNSCLKEVRVARHAMGTRFEFLLYGEREEALRAAAEEALDVVERLDRLLSLYRPESDLSAINREASSRPVRVDPRVFRLLAKVRTLSAATQGAFDPTVAPVLFSWGVIGGAWKVPSAEELEEARSKVGMAAVELDANEGTVRFSKPGMWMDLGAVGKGYALECADKILREAGVNCGLIHGGTSSVCGIGTDRGGLPWRVAVRSPATDDTVPPREFAWHWKERSDGAQVWRGGKAPGDSARLELASSGVESDAPLVSLRDEALSVSAVRGKHFEFEGKTYGHVIDPRTGMPVDGAVLAAVTGSSATDADALSTGLLVAGFEGLALMGENFPGYGAVLACPSAP